MWWIKRSVTTNRLRLPVRFSKLAEMPKMTTTFRRRDLTQALKAAVAAGLAVAGCKITREGTISLVFGKADVSPPANDLQEWDEFR